MPTPKDAARHHGQRMPWRRSRTTPTRYTSPATSARTGSTDHGSRCGRNSRPQLGGSSGTHMPEWCSWSTFLLSHSVVDGRLVVGVPLALELEGAVVDVEV